MKQPDHRKDPMTTEQITLVQASFAQVRPMAGAAAALFYRRLFELDPSLRSLFRTDLDAQGHKLMTTLAMVVQGLSRPEKILPAVQALGSRHAAYGVEAAHYATVGEALVWTLDYGLGEAFTPEAKEAWGRVYTLVSKTMRMARASRVSRELGRAGGTS